MISIEILLHFPGPTSSLFHIILNYCKPSVFSASIQNISKFLNLIEVVDYVFYLQD
jgi:hypothetical protein